MTAQEAIAVFESMGYTECPKFGFPYFRNNVYVCAITNHGRDKIHLNWFNEWHSDIRFQGLVRNSQDILTLSNLLVTD